MANFRIPLASSYDTRVSAVNAADSTSGYVGVGIVGLMIVGKSTQASDKDTRYVNCYQIEVDDPQTGKKKMKTVKRPGYGTQSTPASGKKGYQVMVWTGNGAGTTVISAFDTPNSTIYSATSSLGAISGVCSGITETFVGTTPTLTITSTDSTAWYFDSALAQITDGQFPGNAGKTIVGTFAHIDGFACILTEDSQLWASDNGSVTAWTANSFGNANSMPDKSIGAFRWRNYIMALGRESCEFWQNAGRTPFPLVRVDAMTLKVGAVHADAVVSITDTFWWAGSTDKGGLSVFQWDGSISRVSPPAIDSALILAGASNITLSVQREYGVSVIMVKAGPLTYAYVPETKRWHERSSTTPLWTKTAASSVGGTMVNYAVSNVSTAGKVFLQNQASQVFTDNGVAYTARVQLPNMDLGTMKKKVWEELELVKDEETSSSTITLSYTDDDFQNFTVHGTADLSEDRARWTRMGASRRRGLVLTHSAETPMGLYALEGRAKIGIS